MTPPRQPPLPPALPPIALTATIDVHLVDDQTRAQLDRLLAAVYELRNDIQLKEHRMSQELDELKTAVAADKTVNESAITLLQGLSKQLTDLAEEPAAIRQLAADLQGQSDALAAAVVANTK